MSELVTPALERGEWGSWQSGHTCQGRKRPVAFCNLRHPTVSRFARGRCISPRHQPHTPSVFHTCAPRLWQAAAARRRASCDPSGYSLRVRGTHAVRFLLVCSPAPMATTSFCSFLGFRLLKFPLGNSLLSTILLQGVAFPPPLKGFDCPEPVETRPVPFAWTSAAAFSSCCYRGMTPPVFRAGWILRIHHLTTLDSLRASLS